MKHWWSSPWRPGANRARALRTTLRLESLEERNLMTSGLVAVPNPVINGSGFNGVAAIAANDIWAVGSVSSNNGTVQSLAEHFNGASWSVVPTPVLSVNTNLQGVAAVASNDVWAVGGQFATGRPGTTLIEHWNGTSWSVVPSPTLHNGGSLNTVTAVSSNDVWAAGSTLNLSGEQVDLVEHWNGTSWSVVSSPAFTGGGGVFHISADASNDVWAVQGTAPVLHFDGTNWSQVASPSSVVLGTVTALSPTDVWAGGDTTFFVRDLKPRIATIEHWNGTSWNIVPSPNPQPNTAAANDNSAIEGIAAISANDIWAVGVAGGKTLTEHWGGTSWSIIPSPNPAPLNDILGSVTALSDGAVVAVGAQRSSTSQVTGLILQNAASAPMTGSTPALLAASATTVGDTSGALLTSGSGIDDQTRTLPAPADTATVDQFFAAVGEVDQQLWLLSYNLGTRPTAANGDLDGLPGGM